MTIGDTHVSVEIASTEAAREQGLGGRASLAEGSGMLFVLPTSTVQGIWMKDMRFAIDVLWIDDQGNIITIVEDMAPDSYPQAFYPTAPALYIVELPAGFVRAHDIAIGQKIVL